MHQTPSRHVRRFALPLATLYILALTRPAWTHDAAAVAGLENVVNSPSQASGVLTPEVRGDIYVARKMFREAIETYRKAPESARVDNKIGLAFHQLSLLDPAKKSYERAIRLDPTYSNAINNVGTVYFAERLYGKAIVYYKRSLKYSGPTAPVYVNMGAAYFARHNFSKASAYYEEALRLDPDVFEKHGGIGALMQDCSTTDYAQFHLYLAKAFAKRGEDERALLYLRKALEEGLRDRKKLPDIPEFAGLKNEPGFQDLLAENPKAL